MKAINQEGQKIIDDHRESSLSKFKHTIAPPAFANARNDVVLPTAYLLAANSARSSSGRGMDLFC